MKLLLVALLGLALAGCYQSDYIGSGGGADIKEITLKDGTRCALLIGFSKGAIDCDWHKEVREEIMRQSRGERN